jgi:hypothetical protein
LLTALLGENDVFTYPKSVYAVRDCIQVTVGDRKDALIVDFFAGCHPVRERLHGSHPLPLGDDGGVFVVEVDGVFGKWCPAHALRVGPSARVTGPPALRAGYSPYAWK